MIGLCWPRLIIAGGLPRLAIAISIMAAVAGCSIFSPPSESHSLIKQDEQKSIAGETTAGVVSAAKTTAPNIEVEASGKDGLKLNIKTPAQHEETTSADTAAAENAKRKASGSADVSETIPLGYKLMALAVGLVMLTTAAVLLIMFLRKSAGLRAAWKFGDDFMAKGIKSLEAMARAETDPSKSAFINSIIAMLQEHRAEFNQD